MLFRFIRKILRPVLPAALVLLPGILFPVCAQAADLYPDAYSSHGALSVAADGKVTDVFGHPFQIKGMTIDTASLNADYLTQDTFITLKDELDVNTVRIPVWLGGPDGYCEGDDMTKAVIRSNVYSGLNAAIYQDMYAILEWNITDADDLRDCRDEAHTFLEDIAGAYSGFSNIIYEIGSGTDSGLSWDDFVYYATDLIDCIRFYSPDALIIIGLPDEGRDFLSDYPSLIPRGNLLYGASLNPMDRDLAADLDKALQDGRFPLFVSSFSPVNEDGEIAWQAAGEFMAMLDHYQTGSCFSQLSAADEDYSLLCDWYTGTDGWDDDAYTAAGSWLKAVVTGDLQLPDYVPAETVPSPTDSVLTAGGGIWSFDNGTTVSVSETSSWSDGVTWYTSYDIVVTSSPSAALSGWRLRLMWDCSVGDRDYWSCQIAGEGSSRLIGPAEYNSTIPAGSYASLGIVITSEQAPVLNSVSFE